MRALLSRIYKKKALKIRLEGPIDHKKYQKMYTDSRAFSELLTERGRKPTES